MSDVSVRPANPGWLRAADTLLRSMGGCEVMLRMPAPAASGVDGEQLGMGTPAFQDLPIGPAVFRKNRVLMPQSETPRYELLLSASAVAAQVSALQLGSADVLFAMATGFVIGGEMFLISNTSFTETMGSACVYRVLLRKALLQGE